MPISRLKELLDSNGVKYSTITHSVAYTAHEIASMVHIPGKELAKTVVVNLDGMLVMAVLPASRQVNMERFRLVTEAASARTATEREFKHRFPDCEPGAMPPFGNLYNMRVYVDELLTRDEEIAFNAGTHRELIRLAYRDFARLVQPVIAKFAAGKPGSLRAAGG